MAGRLVRGVAYHVDEVYVTHSGVQYWIQRMSISDHCSSLATVLDGIAALRQHMALQISHAGRLADPPAWQVLFNDPRRTLWA